MTDDEFVTRVEDCTFDGASFHHGEHVRLAFLYLSRYPVLEAIDRLSRALQRFAAFHGKPDRYHQTITWAFVFLIHQRMDGAQTWTAFAGANPELLRWEDNVLQKYYRTETLSSDVARRSFVFPDRFGLS